MILHLNIHSLIKTALLLVLFSQVLIFNSVNAKESTKARYVEKIEICPSGFTNKLVFTCLIPQDLKEIQTILDLEFSIPPVKIFEKNGNRYAEFQLDSLREPVNLIIKAEMLIFRHDITTMNKNNHAESSSILEKTYLQHEIHIEKDDPLFRTIAPRLKAIDTLKTILNIHRFVKNNLTYNKKMQRDVGAREAIKTKKGDCSEYADLFVTLCRANNIPSRVVSGLVTQYRISPRHAWAEVYLNPYGWIRLEPTTRNPDHFIKLKNRYIQLSVVRNDQVLRYRYWGDPVSFQNKISIH